MIVHRIIVFSRVDIETESILSEIGLVRGDNSNKLIHLLRPDKTWSTKSGI